MITRLPARNVIESPNFPRMKQIAPHCINFISVYSLHAINCGYITPSAPAPVAGTYALRQNGTQPLCGDTPEI